MFVYLWEGPGTEDVIVCVLRGFLLELLPSEVADVDISSNKPWYSSIFPWKRSSSSACQHLPQKIAPWTHNHASSGLCYPQGFLATFPAVPHWSLAVLIVQAPLVPPPQPWSSRGTISLMQRRPGTWWSRCSHSSLPTAPLTLAGKPGYVCPSLPCHLWHLSLVLQHKPSPLRCPTRQVCSVGF